eukprot:3250398-Alexandrium_andersonii.AAC.1
MAAPTTAVPVAARPSPAMRFGRKSEARTSVKLLEDGVRAVLHRPQVAAEEGVGVPHEALE